MDINGYKYAVFAKEASARIKGSRAGGSLNSPKTWFYSGWFLFGWFFFYLNAGGAESFAEVQCVEKSKPAF